MRKSYTTGTIVVSILAGLLHIGGNGPSSDEHLTDLERYRKSITIRAAKPARKPIAVAQEATR